MSVGQSPQASTRTSSSPSEISGTGTVSTSTLDPPRQIAASISLGTGLFLIKLDTEFLILRLSLLANQRAKFLLQSEFLHRLFTPYESRICLSVVHGNFPTILVYSNPGFSLVSASTHMNFVTRTQSREGRGFWNLLH